MSVKITPKPKFKLQGVDFATLQYRDCFLWEDTLMMKICTEKSDDQVAVNLNAGDLSYSMCGEFVRPVDVEIKWKRQ